MSGANPRPRRYRHYGQPLGPQGQRRRRSDRGGGARVFYLPQYSPDLNPIEQVFAKLKALLRKAAERTTQRLCRRIAALLAEISPQECSNFLEHAGYAST